ncbi:sentrin-specific protease 5 [Oncorhynchus kisutch]|uniref:sentrin-specific protease 5 n=1 Tax=Oncorhynchus kisutch TaxID=8019 RepID=UPI0009A06A63|nr:sentrin-specific protease 5 [Oncorhynchus kisutch]XP_020355171.1 sentrin-specific protease 5 [Oncorhynchus kisutch]XP_020355172.1 sentrin-specific protease 5 [Oncorhynchus kisutch]XP_031641365.1 sentrin-specific protease 5 [Oncorhynchus kisutch]
MVHNVSVPQTPPPALVGTNGRSSGRKRTPKACDCCGPNSKHHNGKDPPGKTPGGKPRQRRAHLGKGRGQALGETPKRTGGHHSSEKTQMTEEQVTAIRQLANDSVVEEVTNSVAPFVTSSVGQPVMNVVAQLVNNSVSQPQPLTDSMGQPLMNSIGQKLTYTVVKLVTKSVVQPVTNSVVQPIMKAVVEHVPDSEMEQENGCGLDKQPVTDSNTEVMKQPQAGDAAVSLSNGTLAVPNEEPTDCSAPMEVEPSATACVSPGIMLCSTLHPFALWDHRDYCEVGVWAPSPEPEEDCVSNPAQQPNPEDNIHEVIIDLIHEFLAFFYVKYGSFIPLSETDVLEHLKNKCNTDLHDKKLNIHSEMMKYKAGLASTPMKCFKVDYNKHTLTLEDLSTLDDQNWVNDQVINMYGELIMDATQNKVHFFNSFFHRQLVAKGYEGVKRWTKKVDLFSKRLLLIPIHLEIHWSLITVDIANHHIHYYDSQGIVFKYTMENILTYILSEAEEKKQTAYQKGWKTIISKGIPQQKNDSDCGVFILEYCKCLALKEPLQFTQEDMPKVRKRIYKELCDCKLND